MTALKYLVGREAVEGAQRDQLVIGLRPKGEVVDRPAQQLTKPARIVLEGLPGTVRGRLQATLLGRVLAQFGPSRCDHLVEERRQRPGCVQLQLVPEAHRTVAKAILGLLESDWGRLQPAGYGVEPFRERREVAGEQQEQAVADLVRGTGLALPQALRLRVEDGAPHGQKREFPLERAGRGHVGPVQRLDIGQEALLGCQLLQHRVPRQVGQAPVFRMDAQVRAEVREGVQLALEAAAHEFLVTPIRLRSVQGQGRQDRGQVGHDGGLLDIGWRQTPKGIVSLATAVEMAPRAQARTRSISAAPMP